jgi:hypothetical protein
MKSMGFGEFYLETPKGRIDFDRSRGKTFPGAVGRGHLLGSDPPELADELIDAMEQAGASETPLPAEEPLDNRPQPDDDDQGVYSNYYTENRKMNLEEMVRQAVRTALKEKKYRREDEDEEGEEVNETLREAPDQNVEIVGSLIHQHGFMNAREALEQTGFQVDFVTSPLPMYLLEKDGVKYAALNKKYAEDPDLVVGETAIGVMNEELSAKQKELDLDDDGNIDPEDLKGLRAGKEDEDVGKEKEVNEFLSDKIKKNAKKINKKSAESAETLKALEKDADEKDADEKDKNESDNKEWYDSNLFESLMKKWAK